MKPSPSIAIRIVSRSYRVKGFSQRREGSQRKLILGASGDCRRDTELLSVYPAVPACSLLRAGGRLWICMSDRYPLTISHLRQARAEMAAMQERAEEISKLMTAGYGSSDPRAIRTGEVNAALQRLQ